MNEQEVKAAWSRKRLYDTNITILIDRRPNRVDAPTPSQPSSLWRRLPAQQRAQRAALRDAARLGAPAPPQPHLGGGRRGKACERLGQPTSMLYCEQRTRLEWATPARQQRPELLADIDALDKPNPYQVGGEVLAQQVQRLLPADPLVHNLRSGKQSA